MATSVRNRSTRRDPPTLGQQPVNFITYGCESSAPFVVIYKAGREPRPYWWYFFHQFHPLFPCLLRGRRGRDRMVVGFTTTRPISKVGVRTPFMARCNRYNIMWYSLSVTCSRSVDFCLYSTNKTDSNDITDILLKMALNTIHQTKQNLVCHNIIDIAKISQLY
jgi:hypothetical protein